MSMSCRGNAGENDNVETDFGESAEFRYLGTTSHVGFEVLMAVAMKNYNFFDIMPCSPLKLNRRFGGTCRLHLQDLIISQARNQRGEGGKEVELKMETTCPPEMWVDSEQATRRHLPEDRTSVMKLRSPGY
jgi:hypothetical protein